MTSEPTWTVAAAVWMTLVASCSGDDTSPEPDGGSDSAYTRVESIVVRSCAFSATCHGGIGDGQAGLNFARSLQVGGTVVDALTDDGAPKPSCEYSARPLLTPGEPERSWFFTKISGDSRGVDLVFEPDPSWDPGITRGTDGRYPDSECPLTENGEIVFGRLMPWSNSDPMPLPPAEVALIREWIANGAEEPTDG